MGSSAALDIPTKRIRRSWLKVIAITSLLQHFWKMKYCLANKLHTLQSVKFLRFESQKEKKQLTEKAFFFQMTSGQLIFIFLTDWAVKFGYPRPVICSSDKTVPQLFIPCQTISLAAKDNFVCWTHYTSSANYFNKEKSPYIAREIWECAQNRKQETETICRCFFCQPDHETWNDCCFLIIQICGSAV